MPAIAMPRLVEHMTDAVVARWLLADGDSVSVGEEVVEVETDKAVSAIESEFEGTLRIVAAEGSSVAVGERLAEVLVEGEEAPAGGGAETAVAARDPSRIQASPLARRIAEERGIDLRRLAESAGVEKVRKADVESYVGAARVEPSAEAPQELTRTQQLIARRMSLSKSTVPDFAVSAQVEMTACVELRRQLKRLGGEGGPVPSINDIIVKATALTLRAFPKVNSSYRDGAVQPHQQVNVGVAVASEDSLVVPTIADADRASLGAIARRSRELVAAVRDGTITAPDLSGGTFTVSNLGMFGVSEFTAVVNPPQAGILAVGAIEERAVVREGEVVARAMTTLTLCSDHRVIYGADAARFVSHLKRLLENPLAMAL